MQGQELKQRWEHEQDKLLQGQKHKPGELVQGQEFELN